MIYYKVHNLGGNPCHDREFDDAESAVRAAMSYDHEHEVLMCDSQDPTDSHVRFAYIWLNTINLGATASSEFIVAAKRVSADWPYTIAGASQ